MKTIDEELRGLHVDLKCEYCGHEWHQKLIEETLLECGNKCGVNIRMERLPLNEVFTTFTVNPKKINAAAIQANIMSKKIKADLVSNDYNNTIN